MRSAAKRMVELALVHGGVASLARSRRAGQVLVLAYHNIVPHGERTAGDRSLHLPQAAFAAQLDALAETHDIVTLATALAAPATATDRPRAVLTFDDAYLGALTAGVEELTRRALPATVFVAPYFVGGRTFWWDEVAEVLGELDSKLREVLLTQLRGEDARVRDWLATAGHVPRTLPAHARCTGERELVQAVNTTRVTLASHSWSHPNLARLEGAELADELRKPLKWLRQRFDNVLPVISFPYGLDSAATREAVRDAGYSAAMRISGGWMRRREAEPFALPRLDVPAALSIEGFRLRSAGVLGG